MESAKKGGRALIIKSKSKFLAVCEKMVMTYNLHFLLLIFANVLQKRNSAASFFFSPLFPQTSQKDSLAVLYSGKNFQYFIMLLP